MVLRLKARESRSPPGLPDTHECLEPSAFTHRLVAGWSSPVARQAHNLKVVGSNPTPAPKILDPRASASGVFAFRARQSETVVGHGARHGAGHWPSGMGSMASAPSMWPPKPKRMADSIRSAKVWSLRERKRA